MKKKSSGWVTDKGWRLTYLGGTSVVTSAAHVCAPNRVLVVAVRTSAGFRCPKCGEEIDSLGVEVPKG